MNELEKLWEKIISNFSAENAFRIGGALFGFIIAFIAYRIIKKYVHSITGKKFSKQTQAIADKIVKYTFYLIIIFSLLNFFGIKLTALLGAAGIAGVAVGFAAQTSFSNIISGFFVLSEHALKIGDFINVDGTAGTVDSVDLLSVRIVTTDNKAVRIPNETIIKSNLINNSYFPQRRMDVRVSVSYKSDLEKVLEALKLVAPKCPSGLAEPAPVVFFDGFGSSGIEVVLGVWFKNENFLKMKNELYIEIRKTFKEEGIEIPLPQVVIHSQEREDIKSSIS
ncbi:MAG TPA: mechanosensitive ion channel family protein [Treponemataceae bacterium]|jgi:small-conductance mechanosensitive channel|nr:mechanosensitive ion channel family protein [Treponemataceae bacterium]HPX25498.1 mechanosensitive ion channel family protein [Treponemataceae bacterium]HQL05943.1 mechanosensitive ion channel family protein [Treponemataceae bacterium]